MTPENILTSTINSLAVISSDGFLGFFVIFLLIIFVYAFWKAQKAQKLDWTDIITKPNTNEVSLTKILQFVGGIVATWIMIKLTLSEKMTWDLFAIYLAYVASIEGYSKFILARYYGNNEQKNKNIEKTESSE